MGYRLFLDDERVPIGDDWVICRSSDEFIEAVMRHGIPDHMSLDHDLGGHDTGMIAAKWFVEYFEDTGFPIHRFPGVYVHSMNPVGRENLARYLERYVRFRKENGNE